MQDLTYRAVHEDIAMKLGFPSKQALDYQSLWLAAPTEGRAGIEQFLKDTLPVLWRETYVKTITHQPNLVGIRAGKFEYICDIYSDLEAKGEVAFDQTIQDRVVAVFGMSGGGMAGNARRLRRWIDASENLAVTERDHGHLIARCIGGYSLGINVFSQDRKMNRGQSEQGKVYRKMESYCLQCPGTFCFSRPIYADGSSVPRWLEFGLLREDQTLWVELFEN